MSVTVEDTLDHHIHSFCQLQQQYLHGIVARHSLGKFAGSHSAFTMLHLHRISVNTLDLT